MKDITTILFDIDGTILDTREFIFQATEHALKTCGYPVPDRGAISSVVGIAFPEFYHILAGKDADMDKLVEAHRGFQLNNFGLSTPFSGSVERLLARAGRGPQRSGGEGPRDLCLPLTQEEHRSLASLGMTPGGAAPRRFLLWL